MTDQKKAWPGLMRDATDEWLSREPTDKEISFGDAPSLEALERGYSVESVEVRYRSPNPRLAPFLFCRNSDGWYWWHEENSELYPGKGDSYPGVGPYESLEAAEEGAGDE